VAPQLQRPQPRRQPRQQQLLPRPRLGVQAVVAVLPAVQEEVLLLRRWRLWQRQVLLAAWLVLQCPTSCSP